MDSLDIRLIRLSRVFCMHYCQVIGLYRHIENIRHLFAQMPSLQYVSRTLICSKITIVFLHTYLRQNSTSFTLQTWQINSIWFDMFVQSQRKKIFLLELLLSFNYILVFSAVLTHTAGSRVLELSDR